jgi:long-chain acyl-CoA synthetase
MKDIPEMGYLHTDPEPRGEVCLYGAGITPGYFREPKKTSDAIINGWLHTGDVGIVRPDGKIKIIDRVKHIFKLSNGEYVAPEKLENIYVQSKYIM